MYCWLGVQIYVPIGNQPSDKSLYLYRDFFGPFFLKVLAQTILTFLEVKQVPCVKHFGKINDKAKLSRESSLMDCVLSTKCKYGKDWLK